MVRTKLPPKRSYPAARGGFVIERTVLRRMARAVVHAMPVLETEPERIQFAPAALEIVQGLTTDFGMLLLQMARDISVSRGAKVLDVRDFRCAVDCYNRSRQFSGLARLDFKIPSAETRESLAAFDPSNN